MRHTAMGMAATVAFGVAALAPAAEASPASGHTPQAADSAPRVGHSGRWITDDAGRVVLPVGINLMNKQAPYTVESLGFDDADAAFLRRQGFTSVRLGIFWKAVEPQPGVYDDDYLRSIRRTVNLLHSHGLSVLLDMHQDMANEQFQGEGFPDWAIRTDGWPNIMKVGFPGNQFVNVALQRAYDNFHHNAPGPGGVGLADRYAAMWAHVATSFRATPGIIGLDLYNEPWPGTSWLGCLASCGGPDADLSSVQQKAVNAIRRVDPTTAVYYEPFSTFNTGTDTGVQVDGGNVGMSFHDYCTSQAVFGTYGLCGIADDSVFENAQRQIGTYNQMGLLTEFGATTDATTLRAQTDLAMKNRFGWYYWSYSGLNDVTTSGPDEKEAIVLDPRLRPTGGNVDWKKLDSLEVMHPDVVAGTPDSYSYDRSSKVFRMKYAPQRVAGGTFRAGSVTTIDVPSLTRLAGYRVEVDGAHVTSADDAARLTLALDPGATTVTVTVHGS